MMVSSKARRCRYGQSEAPDSGSIRAWTSGAGLVRGMASDADRGKADGRHGGPDPQGHRCADEKTIREVLNMSDITYHRDGDYLIPDLIPPESPRIGVWGMRRKQYLQQHHDGFYTGLLLSGKLNAHLEEIDRNSTSSLVISTRSAALLPKLKTNS